VLPSSRQPARRRRGLAVALVAAALPVLSGCASNFGSPVLQDDNPVTGVNVRQGGVWGLNMLVVLDESGQGTVVGALINNAARDDRLVEVTLEAERGRGPVRTSLVRQQVTLPPDQLVEMSEPPTVAVQGDVQPGLFLGLTLRFQRAEPIQAQVPVMAPEGPYAEVTIPGAAGTGTGPEASTESPSPAESPDESPAESTESPESPAGSPEESPAG
jgi:hypothetical protein